MKFSPPPGQPLIVLTVIILVGLISTSSSNVAGPTASKPAPARRSAPLIMSTSVPGVSTMSGKSPLPVGPVGPIGPVAPVEPPPPPDGPVGPVGPASPS